MLWKVGAETTWLEWWDMCQPDMCLLSTIVNFQSYIYIYFDDLSGTKHLETIKTMIESMM